MAHILCDSCGVQREVILESGVGVRARGTERARRDRLRVVLTCGRCETQKLFEIEGDAVVSMPDNPTAQLEASVVPQGARDLLSEAVLCFYGMAYRAVPGMCRASIEQALIGAGIPSKGNLAAAIEEATNREIIGEDDATLATGARLIGRNSLHRTMPVSQAQSMALLVASTDLLNAVARKIPASQAETDSNEA